MLLLKIILYILYKYSSDIYNIAWMCVRIFWEHRKNLCKCQPPIIIHTECACTDWFHLTPKCMGFHLTLKVHFIRWIKELIGCWLVNKRKLQVMEFWPHLYIWNKEISLWVYPGVAHDLGLWSTMSISTSHQLFSL